MKKNEAELNRFMVEVFNDILKVEEALLLKSGFHNVSLREIHVIEAVCLGNEAGENRAAEIAEKLRITAGTLTTTISVLEKKGYVMRKRDEEDKRAVHIFLTDLGRKMQEAHEEFHKEMIEDLLCCLSKEEEQVCLKSFQKLALFFHNKKGEIK